MLTLENFEDEIDSTILDRGENYWRRGLVLNVKNTDGDISAIVKGTDLYQVKVRLAGQGILECNCSCPYDGDYCKHEVAVFYAISRGNKLPEKQSDDTADLKRMSKDQLIELVQKGRETNLDFDSLYKTKVQFSKDHNKKDDYKRLIRRSVNNAKDRDGFIDYWHASRAATGAENLLDLAETLDDKNIKKQINIYQAIIETMVPVLQYSDDSDGAIGECIEYSLEKLTNISKRLKDHQVRSQLFTYCLKEYYKNKYEGWGYPLRFLGIAGNIADKIQKDKLFQTLDDFLKNKEKSWGDYDSQKAAVIKLKIIERMEGTENADEFIKQNLQFSDIREIAIQKALKKNYLEEAKKLAKNGYDQHQKYPGLVHQFLNHLLGIAKQQNDTDEQKLILQRLFFIGPSREFEHYDKLKKICIDKEWHEILAKIISQIGTVYDLAKIYAKESMWNKLIKVAKESNDQYIAEEYFSKLYKLYPKELTNIYEKVIYQKMKYSGGSGLYQEIVKFLERIIYIGDKEKAKKIAENLKEKYKNRRAMIEELNKINFS